MSGFRPAALALLVLVACLALAPTRAPAQRATDRHPPVTFTALSAGERFTCGLATDGIAWCWGAAGVGQLGAAGIETRCDASIYAKGPCTRAPVEVAGRRRFTAISTGDNHACAIDTDGSGWCWGEAHFGQLGTTESLDTCKREPAYEREERDMPRPIACARHPVRVDAPARMIAIDGGEFMSCAVDREGAAWCWPHGRNATPLRILLDRPLVTIKAGGRMACGLTDEGGIRCWNMMDVTRKGITTPSPRNGWIALDVGAEHACALDADGMAHCWGSDDDAALGIGRTARNDSSEFPLTPVFGTHRFTSIAVGAMRSCGIDREGAMFCWGRVRESSVRPNDRCLDSAWIGDGNDCMSRPAPVHPWRRFASVAIGHSHRCALTTAGTTVCWGENESGQLGDGSLRASDALVDVRTAGVTFAQSDLIDARDGLVAFLLHGGIALVAIAGLLRVAGHRIATFGVRDLVGVWLGAFLLYAACTVVGTMPIGVRSDGMTQLLARQPLLAALGLTLVHVAVRLRAWWRAGPTAASARPATVVALGGSAARRFAALDAPDARPGSSRRGAGALVAVVAGWGLVFAAIQSMRGERYDEVSGGLAMLGLIMTGALATAMAAIAGVVSALRLRRHRDDTLARAALVLAALTVAAALLLVAWTLWPRER